MIFVPCEKIWEAKQLLICAYREKRISQFRWLLNPLLSLKNNLGIVIFLGLELVKCKYTWTGGRSARCHYACTQQKCDIDSSPADVFNKICLCPMHSLYKDRISRTLFKSNDNLKCTSLRELFSRFVEFLNTITKRFKFALKLNEQTVRECHTKNHGRQ